MITGVYASPRKNDTTLKYESCIFMVCLALNNIIQTSSLVCICWVPDIKTI